MKDFLLFKKMITPLITQLIFYLGLIVIIAKAIDSFSYSWFIGLSLLIGGPIFLRVICELTIITFKIADDLRQIRENTRK